MCLKAFLFFFFSLTISAALIKDILSACNANLAIFMYSHFCACGLSTKKTKNSTILKTGII